MLKPVANAQLIRSGTSTDALHKQLLLVLTSDNYVYCTGYIEKNSCPSIFLLKSPDCEYVPDRLRQISCNPQNDGQIRGLVRFLPMKKFGIE